MVGKISEKDVQDFFNLVVTEAATGGALQNRCS